MLQLMRLNENNNIFIFSPLNSEAEQADDTKLIEGGLLSDLLWSRKQDDLDFINTYVRRLIAASLLTTTVSLMKHIH